jgi:thiol-disulfide isomerase/thioredoxin
LADGAEVQSTAEDLAEAEPEETPVRSRPRGLHRYLTFGNVILVIALWWALPRLLPHLGALVGVRSGPDMIPSYDYRSLTGETLSADSLRGRVVLVNFWATWCTPCRVEMPLLEAMYERHREQGFVIVGLAVDQAPTSTVAEYVRARGVTYPVAHVGSEAERRFGGVRGYPTSFLLDRTGRIRHAVLGPIGPLSLEPAVRRLLAEP